MWRVDAPPEQEDTLFKEDQWYVLKLDRMLDADPFDSENMRIMQSGIGHDCRHFEIPNHIQILGGDDCVAGVCWWCKEVIPEAVQTIWTLHNFDYIETLDPEAIEFCKEDAKAARGLGQWEAEWSAKLEKI
jgi:hypothetical protein